MIDNLILNFQQYKKMWIIGGVILMLIVLLGVLTLLNQRPAPKQVLQNPSVELNWWKTGLHNDKYEPILQEFRKIPGNQNVRINVIQKELTENYYDSLLLDLAKGIGPDIFSLGNDDLPAYQEFLAPIEIFRNKELTDYKENYVNLAVRDTISKDKVYGITSYVDNLQLYYNKTILNQNQITVPATSWREIANQAVYLKKLPINTDKFIQSAIALGTGGRSENGPSNIPLHKDILPMLLFQFGGQMYDYQEGKSAMLGQKDSTTNPDIRNQNSLDESSPIYRAMRFYADFADSTTTRYSWNTNNPISEDMFISGNLAYILQYSTFSDIIKEKNSRLNFDVAPLPQIDSDNKRTLGRFEMDVLNKKLALDASKDIIADIKYQKAQEFMFFLSNESVQKEVARFTNYPSSHRNVLNSQLQGDQLIRTFASGSLYADNYYKPDVKRVEEMWSKMFDRVQYENVPLTDSIIQGTAEYDLILSAPPKTR
jgi:ABC-type glycerol-3-phosphate transport system substrate-binding protein